MKKLIALLLVLCMVLSLAACGAKEEPAEETKEEEVVEETKEEAAAEEEAAVEEEAEEEAATEEEAAEEEAATEEEAAEEGLVVDTMILKEADDSMLNTYSAIAVNPEAPFVDADGNAVADVAVNTAGAAALIQWLLTEDALNIAAEYGVAEYGEHLFYVNEDVPTYTGEIAAATEETKVIRLSTTTSVNDSGLLGALLPEFEAAYGYTVEVQSAGTGKAIAAAKNGNADLILVHSKKQEEAFIEEGFGLVVDGFEAERVSFIHNFYVLCGPSADPAGAKDAATVLDAFAAIASGEHPFVSRGDGSGTHTKEISLWPADLGIAAEAETFVNYTGWYTSANAGMGACLVMAEEMGAYILTDKATFMTFVANDGVMD